MCVDLIKQNEEEKVHQFLMGLDDAIFGIVRSNIWHMDTISNIKKA